MRVFSAAGILILAFITFAVGGGLGTPKKEDVPKYLEMLKKSDKASDRALAARMLGKRGAIRSADVKDAIEPLKLALEKDVDLKVRGAAAEALGSISADPEGTVPLLITTLKEKDTGLKLAVIDALAKYGPDAKDALPSLREILKDKSDKVLTQA